MSTNNAKRSAFPVVPEEESSWGISVGLTKREFAIITIASQYLWRSWEKGTDLDEAVDNLCYMVDELMEGMEK